MAVPLEKGQKTKFVATHQHPNMFVVRGAAGDRKAILVHIEGECTLYASKYPDPDAVKHEDKYNALPNGQRQVIDMPTSDMQNVWYLTAVPANVNEVASSACSIVVTVATVLQNGVPVSGFVCTQCMDDYVYQITDANQDVMAAVVPTAGYGDPDLFGKFDKEAKTDDFDYSSGEVSFMLQFFPFF